MDDRLIGPDGKPDRDRSRMSGFRRAPSAGMAGEAAAAEAKRRGWELDQIGVLRIAYDSLETGRERTFGARDALVQAGIPAAQIFDAPQRTTDTEGGFTAADPVLTRNAAIRHWIIIGLNDETVLGGVRAAEGSAARRG